MRKGQRRCAARSDCPGVIEGLLIVSNLLSHEGCEQRLQAFRCVIDNTPVFFSNNAQTSRRTQGLPVSRVAIVGHNQHLLCRPRLHSRATA